jgi:uncharacterized protein (DUF2235 family)
MPKRIVVCSDGTGNTAIKGRGTNVFKLFEAVDLESHRFNPDATTQIAIYDDGVGTEHVKPLKIFAGATGWGLSRNVMHLYKELSRVYDPGDEIYMFGFSRGAFTVRTLVGLIATCGLINPERLERKTFRGLESSVKNAYRAYRKCYRPWLWRWFLSPPRNVGAQFRAKHFVEEVKIRFVGVWDTVDAVGLPFHLSDVLNGTLYQFKFPNHELSPIVERAAHALAIDDQRQSFHPLLWTETSETSGRIKQVWFAGAHSNVGGGYPKQGMSLVALDWLLTEAENAGTSLGQPGLRLNAIDRQSFRAHASVDDKLYDPRAGLGIFYRWRIRNIDAICAANGVTPQVHVSVLERIAHGTDDYSPGNLPARAKVVYTKPPVVHHSPLADLRAAGVERVLRRIPDGTLLNQVKKALWVGESSYYLFVVTCLWLLLAVSGTRAQDLLLNPGTAISQLGTFLATMTQNPVETIDQVGRKISQDSLLWLLVTIGLGGAYGLSLAVDRRLDTVFSGFWYGKQTQLRENLKAARNEVKKGNAAFTASLVAEALNAQDATMSGKEQVGEAVIVPVGRETLPGTVLPRQAV